MNCATTGLSPFVATEEQPWSKPRIQHLFRRLSFGATPSQLASAASSTAQETVTALLGEAAASPPPPEPEWAYWDYEKLEEEGVDAFETYVGYMQDFTDRCLEHGVREKLTLFWHNHFVTLYESYSCPSYLYQYWKVLTEHALGNFRDFVIAITETPAMLMFLNGFENKRQSPNENYARELFELFTLGINNGYTQQDITEASRALTGFNQWTSYCGPLRWAEWGFDATEKTVFGRTGNFDYKGLIEVLFEERGEEVARFVCGKLYRHFVNPRIDEAIVEQLATTLVEHDFELLPMLKELFSSAHFFDPSHVGVQVKSPVMLLASFLREGGFGTFEQRRLWSFWGQANMGQQLGQPPDVAGWQGDRAWIDANRITRRWDIMDGFTWAVHHQNLATYPAQAEAISGSTNSPEIIARAIVDHFLPRGLTDESAYQGAIDALKWEVPANYYENDQWSLYWESASWQVTILLRHLARLPEFQLH